MPKLELQGFIDRLQSHPLQPQVFNPWREYDPVYDLHNRAPEIRRENLANYLRLRLEQAKYILVAEAVGYQGAKFSGVPLTSERMLLGNHNTIGPGLITRQGPAERTSNPNAASNKAEQKLGYTEPTATIVWETLLNIGIDPFSVIQWNIFPFHPFYSNKGHLSNRTPTDSEIQLGLSFLNHLKQLCKTDPRIITIGRRSAKVIDTPWQVIHPANGGARKFKEVLPTLVGAV